MMALATWAEEAEAAVAQILRVPPRALHPCTLATLVRLPRAREASSDCARAFFPPPRLQSSFDDSWSYSTPLAVL